MLHRGDVGHVDRMFLSAEPLRRVVHDAGRRDQHLGREEPIARDSAAGAEHVARCERPALPPDDSSTDASAIAAHADRRIQRQPRRCYRTRSCAVAADVELPARYSDADRPPARRSPQAFLSGKPIRYYRPRGSADVRHLIDEGFQAFNAARLGEACRIFADKMLLPEHDTTIGLTVAGALTPAGLGGCVIELMERGLVDFVISTGANLYHDLHYALNFTLHRGSPFVDDVELYEEGVIRIYDVLFPAHGAARNRRLHPRLPRALRARTARCPPPSSTTRSGSDLLERAPGLRGVLGRRARPRAAACRSTPRRPATARSG